MTLLGIRFCVVSQDGADLAKFLGPDGLGLKPLEIPTSAEDGFAGAIFPSETGSWVEVWPLVKRLPAGIMLQLVVDDADAVASQARAKGVDVHGPTDAHGERIYSATAPGGLPLTFQSTLG